MAESLNVSFHHISIESDEALWVNEKYLGHRLCNAFVCDLFPFDYVETIVLIDPFIF